MKAMKNVLLGLLVLITLTPVMACAMSYCPMQSSNAGAASCHESKSSTELPMLSVDCMGVDLFQVDSADNVPQPNENALDYVTLEWAQNIDIQDVKHVSIGAIRAPPLITANLAPSLILTTGRYRI